MDKHTLIFKNDMVYFVRDEIVDQTITTIFQGNMKPSYAADFIFEVDQSAGKVRCIKDRSGMIPDVWMPIYKMKPFVDLVSS